MRFAYWRPTAFITSYTLHVLTLLIFIALRLTRIESRSTVATEKQELAFPTVSPLLVSLTL